MAAECARQDLRAVLHDQGGRARARALDYRPSTASSNSPAGSSLRIRKPARERVRYLSSGSPRRTGRGACVAAAKAKKDELWGSGTVFLVEDEPMVRSVAERALTRHGYKVHDRRQWRRSAGNLRSRRPDRPADQRRRHARDGRPDVVREARKSRPDLKILFMSGYAEEQLRKSIDIENVNFLPKPFSVTELAEAARRAVGTK